MVSTCNTREYIYAESGIATHSAVARRRNNKAPAIEGEDGGGSVGGRSGEAECAGVIKIGEVGGGGSEDAILGPESGGGGGSDDPVVCFPREGCNTIAGAAGAAG